MELPDLCEICGGVPIDDETLLRTPKFFYREHGDCWCEPTEDADADAQEDGWGSLTDYDPKDISYYERGISEPT